MPVEAKPLFRPDVLRSLLSDFYMPPVDSTKLNHWASEISSGRRVPLLACPAVLRDVTISGMKRTTGHRKRVQHIDDPGHVRELTFSFLLSLLTNDVWRRMLSESIDRATRRHRYRLVAFVYMPEHVHLMAFPIANASGVDVLLNAIKRPFSYRVKQLLIQSGSRLLQRLTIRQRPGVATFRFWQEGPGYDRNLTKPKTVLAAIDYVHQNPFRRGLVKNAVDWRWSSARYYLADAPRRYPGLPTIHPLPSQWLSETE